MKIEHKDHYLVTFYSPGTFFSETSSIRLDELDINKILKKAKGTSERYNAKPYGYTWKQIREFFIGKEKLEKEEVLDESKGYIFITGNVIFSKDLTNPDENIFKSNLESNAGGVGIQNFNSYKFSYFFDKNDIIIDWDGNIIRSGNDKDLIKYREEVKKQNEEKYKEFLAKKI